MWGKKTGTFLIQVEDLNSTFCAEIEIIQTKLLGVGKSYAFAVKWKRVRKDTRVLNSMIGEDNVVVFVVFLQRRKIQFKLPWSTKEI